MKTIYGPVMSWRIGECFNVDPICRTPKVCSFNCVYCKFGNSGFVAPDRIEMVSAKEFADDLKTLTVKQRELPLRFSGSGEPTIAKNLGELIQEAKEAGTAKTVVVTNSSLLDRMGVRDAIKSTDIIIAGLSASDECELEAINRPHPDIKLNKILNGLHAMRSSFKGSFRMQVMLVEGNRNSVERLAQLCNSIGPEIVYLSTPTRSSSCDALSRKVLLEAARTFERCGCQVALEGRT